MSKKATPAFNHPKKMPISKPCGWGVETHIEEHDLEELCATAHFNEAIDRLAHATRI
jgi:hypothetical protein